MGQVLGSLCSRRRNTNDEAIILNENIDEWELIPPGLAAVNAPPPNVVRRTFKSAVRQVVKLLHLRKLWSRLGTWLNATANHRAYRVGGTLFHRRQLIQIVWSQLGSYLRAFAVMFRHLRRNRGRLEYV